jgi:hypothetical protein
VKERRDRGERQRVEIEERHRNRWRDQRRDKGRDGGKDTEERDERPKI